jgi:cation-transporting ATPase E
MLVCDIIPAEGRSEQEQTGDRIRMSEYIEALPDDNMTMKALADYFPSMGSGDCVSNLPFSSVRKYSGVQFNDKTYVLGAPDIILQKDYDKYKGLVNEYACKGLRVIVFAEYSENESSVPVPENGTAGGKVTPVMFVLLQNPLRENAAETFAYFKKQSVEVKVISGDNPVTVSEVARQAGIQGAEKYVDVRSLDDEKLSEAAVKYTVFGRVQPEQKQKLVKALQKAGHKVAMTGDGVNDILAMKDADCSIAMAAGSEAAMQAAQVVLLDSDFSHMKQIVSEGRRDINNITRSATLFLVKNIFSLLLSIFAIVSLMTYPLQASQVTFISMFNIGIPAFFFALEDNTKKSSGSFMVHVLMKALPAAITDFLAIAALVLFGETFGVSTEDISVAATFVMTIVGFMILINISSPMNKFRTRVILGCIIGMIFAAVVFSDLFAITYVSKECIMLFVLFVIATEPCMRYLTMLCEWIENKLKNRKRKSK